MTWVVGTVGVDYADYKFGEGQVGVACSLDERFAKEEGEVGVAIIG